MSKPVVSQIRHNLHSEVEAQLNKQINMELHASYAYLSIAYYFHQDDVALNGFYEFFRKMSEEEKCHAEIFMKYQNSRGGRILLRDIKVCEMDLNGNGPLHSMEESLKMESEVNKSLLSLYETAAKYGDHQTQQFLDPLMKEQTDSMFMFGCHITNLKRLGEGVGEYMFDKQLSR